MSDPSDHQAFVRAWLDSTSREKSSEQLLHAFEHAFDAIWERALLTLGEVTLTAIADRVFYNAAEKFPMLSALTVEADRPRWHELREQASKLSKEQVEAAIQLVLVELLTVVGSLTAEILTPALQAALEASTSDEKDSEVGAS